jgi:Ca2+-binding EF-hand superfamily protein
MLTVLRDDLSGHVDREELGEMLFQLEYTYSDQFVDFLLEFVFRNQEVHTSEKRKKGTLLFEEFFYFMNILYNLHGAVLDTIDGA